MPPVVKRRGRPKGHTLTVCGLPAKRRGTRKPVSFSLMHTSQKQKSKGDFVLRREVVLSYEYYRKLNSQVVCIMFGGGGGGGHFVSTKVTSRQ